MDQGAATMNKIEQIIDTTIGKEGGYANHPDDKGGETMWGITKVVARRNGYYGEMRSMPRPTAVDIYTREFFTGPQFDKVLQRSIPLAEELFDTGVLSGPGTASRFLQVALNGFNNQGKLYGDIATDGAIGKGTLAALDAYLDKRGASAVVVMMRALNSQQGAYFLDISQTREANESFTFGWFLNRVVI